MTKVYCSNYDCKHCDTEGCCTLDIVAVGDDYEYGCDDYSAYYDSPEYGEKYYKAVFTVDKVKAKAEAYGKKIEYNGRTFYTGDKVTEDDDFFVTDERTGLAIKFSYLKKHWVTYLEVEKQYPDVDTLPLAVFDEKRRKFKLVEERN